MANRDLTAFPKLAYGEGTDMQYLGKQGLALVNKLIGSYQVYDGKHWLDSTGKELTPAMLKATNALDYEPTMITANLTAWFIDRLAAFLFERPISLACPSEQVDEAELQTKPEYQPSEAQKAANTMAAARERLLYKVMKQNMLHEKLLRAGKDYHIATGVCAKLHMDENRGLRIIWRPRLEYWPVYNTDDVDVLEKIHFVAFTDDNTIWKQTYSMQAGSCWMEEATYDLQLKVKEQIVVPYDMQLPFIPVEVFTYGGLTGETEGRSLVDVLSGLNRELEKKISDNADSLRFGMFAITAVLNASLPTKEEVEKGEAEPLQKAPNALWNLQSSDDLAAADVKVIEHNFSYQEILKDHIETLVGLMHKLANVPNISPDQIKGLGQLSGFAIRLMYGSIISATNQSMITWGPRLQRLFGKALYLLNEFDISKHYDQALIDAAKLTEINLGDLDDLVQVKTQMPIPENETELVDLYTKKIATMLESIKGAMDAMGVENPESKLAEILAEKMAMRETMGDVNSNFESTPDLSGGDKGGGTGGGE
ncbi:MAG: phage portal protein [Carboxydocellales bacterium]